MPRLPLTLVVAILCLPVPEAAGQATPASPPPCTAAEYRQFDFWEGRWDVYDSTGQQQIGTNRLEKVYGGCVLQEHWVALGPQQQTGSSFNTYHPGSKKWYQTWVDDTGGFLLLSGGLVKDTMVLTGEMLTPRGLVHHRISWSRINGDPDQVRQYWETSTDGGQTWTVGFNGLYRRHRGG